MESFIPPMPPPLTLLQVLEEEYQAVHGKLPPGYVPPGESATEDVEQPAVAADEAAWTDESSKRQRTKSELRADQAHKQLQDFYEAVHRGESQAALCLSGGGIRSATFSLGVIQALAKWKLLERFDYLSTVSGGGYIGSWLTAWIQREGAAGPVFDELRASTSTTREPVQIVHLREYSNYLSPRMGLLSVDFWALLAIYLRNLLLNWLVILPALMLPILVPRLYVAALNFTAQSPGSVFWLVGVGALLQAWAIAQLDWSQPSLDEYRTKVQRRRNRQGRFVRWIWLPLVLSAFLLTIGWYGMAAGGGAVAFWKVVGFQSVVSISGWLVNFAASMISCGAAARETPPNQPRPARDKLAWRLAKELPLVLVAGALGGALMWRFGTWLMLVGGLPDAVSRAADAPLPETVRVLTFACLALPLFLTAFLLSGALLHGIINALTFSDSDLEWTARSAGWSLIAISIWAVGSCVVLWGPILTIALPEWLQPALVGTGGLAGLVVGLLGKSEKTLSLGDAAAAGESSLPWSARWRGYALKLAIPVFILFIVIGLTLASDWLMQTFRLAAPAGSPGPAFADRFASLPLLPTLTVWAAIFLLWSFGFGCVVNVNKFSLHEMYRNRLIRAYLGASRPRRTSSGSYVPFTGFDGADNLRLCQIDRRRNWDVQEAPVEDPARRLRPLHVINIALNLVSGKQLAWQERKAESFTATALHCGSGRREMGYRRSEEYGGGKDHWGEGWKSSMSLGGAMAISGAAASPNMGYHSSTTLAFLMTLLNVRLGAWFGNPGKAGARHWPTTYGCSSPRQAIRPLVDEALGLTDDTHPYVYLSDGGHFENLGLYEMVRRRCKRIVVCDAGQDEGCAFDDLGNAVRKIYVDLGVRIKFDTPLSIFPRRSVPEDGTAGYSAVGKILYSDVDGDEADDGAVLYLKPAFYGMEPADVYSYAKRFDQFPHDTTMDQFFSESQFESYRGLGFFVMDKLCASLRQDDIDLDGLMRGSR